MTGDKLWFYNKFCDSSLGGEVDGFAGLFAMTDRFKPKRPAELAVEILTKLESAWSASAADYGAIVSNPVAFDAFIGQYRLLPNFMTDIIALGAPMFLLSVAQHILGDDIDTFVDRYNSNIREFYTRIVQPALSRNVGALVGGSANLAARRLSDVTVALVVEARALAEAQAKDFLVRIGYAGDNQIMPATMKAAFEGIYNTWHAQAVGLASSLLKPGELMRLVSVSQEYYNRVTVYRRATESQPRLKLSFVRSGETTVWSATFRDKSMYVPVTDKHTAGYLNMAYAIDGTNLIPIVDTDDINSLMLDLTLPSQEQAIETVVEATALPTIVSANPGIIFRSEHVERYLADEGFNASSELASFGLELPKGAARDIFSITDMALPVGTNTAETLTILEHPEVYTSCVMRLLGDTYNVQGVGAKEYARYFAAQTFGALVPYTADSGNITIQSSDMLRAPRKVAELPSFIGVDTTHFLDKTLIRRLATTHLNINESVLNDSEITVLGKSLLKYYLQVLYMLGFGDLATVIRASTGISTESRAQLDTRQMVLTWGTVSMWNNRLKPLGLSTANETVRYRLAMLQVYMSKITNDKVLKAFLHAMSIYLAYETTDLSTGSITGIWKGTLLSSLFTA